MKTCGTPRTFGSGPPSGSLGELTVVQNGENSPSSYIAHLTLSFPGERGKGPHEPMTAGRYYQQTRGTARVPLV